jgi:hypothetical protein
MMKHETYHQHLENKSHQVRIAGIFFFKSELNELLARILVFRINDRQKIEVF